MDMLRDPIWQAIGAIIAIAGLLYTYFVTTSDRNKKSLSCEIIAVTPLLPVSSNIPEANGLDILVTYNGNAVNSPYLIVLQVANNGTQPITTKDYEESLQFAFETKTKILSSEIVNAEPNNLVVTSRFQDNLVTIDNVLLNEGDYYSIQLVVNHYSRVRVKSRIIGVKKVVLIEKRKLNIDTGTFTFFFSSVIALYIILLILFHFMYSKLLSEDYIVVLIFALLGGFLQTIFYVTFSSLWQFFKKLRRSDDQP